MKRMMRLFNTLIVLMTVTSYVMCQGLLKSAPVDSIAVDQEFEVYRFLLEHRFGSIRGPIVVNRERRACEIPSHLFYEPEKFIDELKLAKTYNDCALKPKAFMGSNDLKNNPRLIPIKDQEHRDLFKDVDCEVGWRSFYRNFPKALGYASFSRVGFDESRTFAIVEFSYIRGCLSGEGALFLLKKVDGNWKVVTTGAHVMV